VIQSLQDRVRGFLRFRIERAPPRRGPKPAIGAYVVCEELRMTIQAGVTDDLWEWLMGQGWRELRYAPDGRHYLVVLAPCVTKLIDAPEEQRPIALSVAVLHASFRPIIGDPNALPSYVVRHSDLTRDRRIGLPRTAALRQPIRARDRPWSLAGR